MSDPSRQKPGPTVWINDEVTRQFRRMSEQLLGQQRAMAERLSASIKLPPIGEQLRDSLKIEIPGTLQGLVRAAEAARRHLERALPGNWRGMSSADFMKVMDLAETGTVAVVWAPRQEFVVELARAETHH